MKHTFSLPAVVSVVACSVANAASVTVVTSSTSPTAYSIYLNGESANGNFDTVFVKLLPNPGSQFTNQNSGLSAGVPRPAGQPFSYRNRLLDADPADFPGGLGWTILGAVNTANELSFTGGPLGGKIDTGNPTLSAPGLFLVNVNMPTGYSIYQVQIINGGVLVQDINGPLLDPEPSAAILGSMAIVGLAAIRRRSTSTLTGGGI